MENLSDNIEKFKSDKIKIVADFIAVKKENQKLFYSLQEGKKENDKLREENIELKRRIKEVQRSTETPKNKLNDVNVSESEIEYEVEMLLKHRKRKGKQREFLVRWKNYSPSNDTWETEDRLKCPALVNYLKQNRYKTINFIVCF